MPGNMDPFAAAGWRPTVVNWEGQLQRLVDDYLPFASLDQAVQKDGIQNSWDGRTNRKRGTGWSVTLELQTDGDAHRYLTITDSGTTGLTGRVLEAHEYLTYLPEDERWARFESLAFTHDPAGGNEDYLGARGQGKFIFVGASKKHRILYDSLRPDGSYRLGARYVDITESPVNSWDGDDARKMLAAFSAELKPLSAVGTRVIVDDPVEDVVVAMTGPRMKASIGDTWWAVIEKYGADLRVAVRTGDARTESKVDVPADLVLPRADTKRYKVWLRENQRIDVAGSRYVIKRGHFAFDANGAVRPEIQGIGIVRGGMLVQRLPVPGIPSDVAARITGYVEFDSDLDTEMKRLESPNHYTFNLRRGVGLRVKHWVEDELGNFAAEKLGVGRERGANTERARRDAEKRALDELNRRARELGLVGLRGRAGGGGGGGGGGHPKLPITVQLGDPVLPRPETRRIDFDETMTNITLRVVNNTDAPLKARTNLYATRGDTMIESFIKDSVVEVAPYSTSDWTKGRSLKVTAEDFLPGPYVLRAKLVVLESPHRPKMWEERDGFKFWVEEDPPQGGLFDDVRALDYTDEFVRVDGEAVPEANGWIFQYNVLHPAFLRIGDNDDELTEYLFGLMVREMIYVDLSSGNSVLFDEAALRDNRAQQRRAATIEASVLFDYFQGA
jgi:hypothetical protein